MKILIASTRREFNWYFFVGCQENYLKDIFSTPKSFLHNKIILLIKKYSYQIYTNRKYLEGNLQHTYYLFRIKNVNMIESIKLRQAILRHSKPEF